MAKPSVTNIRPPSQTTNWTPPKTNWDLNNATDWANAEASGFGADDTDAGYNTLTGNVNLNEPSPLDLDLGSLSGASYDYVFYGVNGGYDETVKGKTGAAGIIVTGNGMDNITGGDLGDLIFSGNGKDVVNAGGGNDIVFGENGADKLNAGSDTGHAAFESPGEGQGETVLTVIEGAVEWDHDPNGESEIVGVPQKTTVSKEGFYIELDDNGHPTELDGDGNPVVHAVYSITPNTDGKYTIAYTHGNALDGDGNPEFEGPPPSDQHQVELTAGTKYYFSLIYDAGHATVFVNLFADWIEVTGNNQTDPKTVATSEAVPDPGWETFFTSEEGPPGGQGVFEFTAGDQLIGGNGPDTFIWNASDNNNVDLIWDYNQGDGTYNPLEGDVLQLNGVLTGLTDTSGPGDTPDGNVDKYDLTTFLFDVDGVDQGGDSDLADDLVIYVSADHAVGLAGINSIEQVDVVFGT